jgi:two-component system, sensor histidine kinase and response regulator
MLEMAASRQSLARQAEQMAALATESLRASREAESYVRAREEFLAMINHEIRTPLNGIMGMTSVLLSCNLPEVERECVETIKTSGEAMMAIVSDVLDFSQLQSGYLQLRYEEFDLPFTVDEALRIVRVSAKEKGVTLSVEIGSRVPKLITGDRARLRQILLNLLSNAVKFTRTYIELRIELFKETKGPGYLLFTVKDDGIGIAKEQQSSLFQPFRQADTSIFHRFGGTGLGLAISKRLIEIMGGNIGVESSLGHGAVFWFTMPYVR